MELVALRTEISARVGEGPEPELPAFLRMVRLETLEQQRRHLRVEPHSFLEGVATRAGEGLGERPARRVDRPGRRLRRSRRARQRRDAVAVEPPDLVAGERVGVEAQFVDLAAEELAAVVRADAARRRAAGRDPPRPLQGPDLRAVQVDAHRLPVEHGRDVVPEAVGHLRRIDLRVALDVAGDVQAQREDAAMLLEREEDAPLAVLLAEDLVVGVESRRLHPDAEGEFRHRTELRIPRASQQVPPCEVQSAVEHARDALESPRAPLRRGVAAVAARVAAEAPRRLVEGPAGDQRPRELERSRGRGGGRRGRGEENEKDRRAFHGLKNSIRMFERICSPDSFAWTRSR